MKRHQCVWACAHRWSFALLLLVAAHIYRTEPPALAQGTAKANPSIDIPMELVFNRPLLRGTVNGEGPIAMLIDPQLQTTLVSPVLVERLKLKAPRNSGSTARLSVDLGFGAFKTPKVPVEVGDTAGFVPELGPTAQPFVVLGLSTWSDQLVTLDYGRFQVHVAPGALPEPNGRDVHALAPVSNELRVNLEIGGRAVGCRIDPLFPGTVLFPASYLKELPLATKPTEAAPARTRDGSIMVREARLAESIMLASAEIKSPLVLFGNVDLATVGYGALARLSVTYDFSRRRAQLNRQQ
jgi:hypothetical protein